MDCARWQLAVVILLALTCLSLTPRARAICQQGCLINNNTALGDSALLNTTGFQNTAIGFQALFSNTIGNSNTAIGFQALEFNTTGNNNTATGGSALQFNTTGTENTATGVDALFSNTTGKNNTAHGAFALTRDTTGHDNTAVGEEALETNTTGSFNIAIGSNAGFNLTTGSNNIDIGNLGVARDANTIRIGTQETQIATFIAGIRGVPISGAQQVSVNADGQLGVRASSARFKEAIKPMDEASEAILALHPVSFRYKKELDPKRVPQFGLIAEEVAKVNSELVVADDQGKPLTVRYEEINAMLLNEFLKEHRTVEELKKEIAALTATVGEQASQIRNIRAEVAAASPSRGGLEATKSSSQIALNNQ